MYARWHRPSIDTADTATPYLTTHHRHYLNLLDKDLATPPGRARRHGREELLACVSGSHTQLRILPDAATVLDLPDFADVLPAAID